MSFVNAVKYGFRNYVNFKGRASRAQYWWWTLFSVIANIVVSLISQALGDFVTLVLLLPSIAIGFRRMHDTDHVGWWMFLPIVNLVFALGQGS